MAIKNEFNYSLAFDELDDTSIGFSDKNSGG